MPTLSEYTLGVFDDDAVNLALAATITPSTHPHTRARILAWAVARLRAGALEPARILKSRAIPLAIAALPAIHVYALGESGAEPFDTGKAGRAVQRPLTMSVHIVVAKDSLPAGIDFDEVHAAFAWIVERILLLDSGKRTTPGALGVFQFFGGDAVSCDLGPTSIEYADEGERLVAHHRIDFAVDYQDELVALDTPSPLEIVDASWDLAPPDAQIDATDEIEIEQS